MHISCRRRHRVEFVARFQRKERIARTTKQPNKRASERLTRRAGQFAPEPSLQASHSGHSTKTSDETKQMHRARVNRRSSSTVGFRNGSGLFRGRFARLAANERQSGRCHSTVQSTFHRRLPFGFRIPSSKVRPNGRRTVKMRLANGAHT